MKSNFPPSEHSEQPNTLGDLIKSFQETKAAEARQAKANSIGKQVVLFSFVAWVGFSIVIYACWGLLGLGLWFGIPFALLALFSFAKLCFVIRKGGAS